MRMRHGVLGVSVAIATLWSLMALPAAQPTDTGGACVPDAERAGRTFGCFIMVAQPIGRLPPNPYWHVETFPSRAAADKARGAQGAVMETFGKVWLLTIAAKGYRSPGGTHAAEIGPLPTTSDVSYMAKFMEAVFRPGMKSRIHRHSGPEAWYTVSGETCLETPEGRMVDRSSGSHVIVPMGPPMELTAIGAEVRRSLVLILHDETQPHTTTATDWTPRGLCTTSR